MGGYVKMGVSIGWGKLEMCINFYSVIVNIG